MVNSNLGKNKAQHAWHEFNLLADLTYSRFFWSLKIMDDEPPLGSDKFFQCQFDCEEHPLVYHNYIWPGTTSKDTV